MSWSESLISILFNYSKAVSDIIIKNGRWIYVLGALKPNYIVPKRKNCIAEVISFKVAFL